MRIIVNGKWLNDNIHVDEDIKKGHVIGVSQAYHDGIWYMTTHGYYNHSENPNCEAYKKGFYIKLKSIKPIKKDEELTVKYWLYDVKKEI